MKNKLTKIYNIFKQIENLNGNVGWDQTKSFYYFYENNKLVDCWKLLYGLFCENKNLKPSVFGITLLELRKYSNGFSVIYEFEELNEIPILVATFSRNGKHQISGKVKVEETSVSEAKVVEFVDGVNVDEDFDDEGSPANDVEIDFLHVDDLDLSLLVYNNLVVCFHDDNDELIEIENESEVQEYLELYNDNRLFIFKNELADKGISENFKEELTGKCPPFNIAGVIPYGLYSTSDCILFLDYLNNKCALKGVFHPDDSFENYCDSDGKQIFTKNQIELYSKYLDDMFEMDSDGNSEFVKLGYEDVYDFCMNYTRISW